MTDLKDHQPIRHSLGPEAAGRREFGFYVKCRWCNVHGPVVPYTDPRTTDMAGATAARLFREQHGHVCFDQGPRAGSS